MALYDYPTNNQASPWGGILTDLTRATAGIYMSQQARRRSSRAARRARHAANAFPDDGWNSGGRLSQRPGWGVDGPPTGGIGWGGGYAMPRMRLDGAPVPYGRAPAGTSPGIFGQGVSDWLRRTLPAGPWDVGRGDVYDPTPGPWAADDPRSQDAQDATDWGDVDYRRAEARARRAAHPSKVLGPDGRVYVSQGRPVLFSADLTAVRRVQRVAGICSRALSGVASHRRRKKVHKRRRRYAADGCAIPATRSTRRRRRRVSVRTLSPKQLAAGFGGRAYRR